MPGAPGPAPARAAHEGLAQRLQPLGGHDRAAVGQPQPGPPARAGERHLHSAARDIVPHRIAQQIRHRLAQQHRVPLHDDGAVGGTGQGHLPRAGLRGELGQRRTHHLGQVHLLAVEIPRLGLRQVEQGVDGLHIGPVGLAQPLRQGPQLLGGGVGVGQGDVNHRLGRGQRGAQLVGGVGREAAVGAQRGLQGVEHVVVGVSQVADLVARALQRQALAEVARGGPLGRLVHRRQRGEHPAGDHPADRAGGQGEQDERPQGDREHLVEELGHEGDAQVDLPLAAVRAHLLLGDGQLEAAHVEVDEGDEGGARPGHQARVGQGEPGPDGQSARAGVRRRPAAGGRCGRGDRVLRHVSPRSGSRRPGQSG